MATADLLQHLTQAQTPSAELKTHSDTGANQRRLVLKSTAVLVSVLLASTLVTFIKPQTLVLVVPEANASMASSKESTAHSQPQPLNLKAASTQATTNAGNHKVLDASGHVIARRVANISSRVTGKLAQLLIEEGQQVNANDTLALLDNQQAKLQLQLVRAQLKQQQQQLQKLQLQADFAEKQASRQIALLKQQLTSQQSVDSYQQQLQLAQADINNQQALIATTQQQLDLAEYQLSLYTIKAPFSGVVISKNAQVGELISAGNSGGSIRTGVGTIVDMSSLEVEVDVSENYIQRIHTGMKAIATLDAYPDWAIDSEVIAIIPTANRQKASVKVRVKLNQLDSRIFPDMGVKVSFLETAQQG